MAARKDYARKNALVTRKRGRPPVLNIDPKEVEACGANYLTIEQTAAYLGCSDFTIRTKYLDAWRKGRAMLGAQAVAHIARSIKRGNLKDCWEFVRRTNPDLSDKPIKVEGQFTNFNTDLSDADALFALGARLEQRLKQRKQIGDGASDSSPGEL